MRPVAQPYPPPNSNPNQVHPGAPRDLLTLTPTPILTPTPTPTPTPTLTRCALEPRDLLELSSIQTTHPPAIYHPRCALEPRDLLELGPDAHRAGATYTLEASERLIVLLFRRREEGAVAE